jgi:hypothetical protein
MFQARTRSVYLECSSLFFSPNYCPVVRVLDAPRKQWASIGGPHQPLLSLLRIHGRHHIHTNKLHHFHQIIYQNHVLSPQDHAFTFFNSREQKRETLASSMRFYSSISEMPCQANIDHHCASSSIDNSLNGWGTPMTRKSYKH